MLLSHFTANMIVANATEKYSLKSLNYKTWEGKNNCLRVRDMISCFRSLRVTSVTGTYIKYKTMKHKEEKQEEILRLQGKQRFLRL